MKFLLAVLCLLLCGCSNEVPPEETKAPTVPVTQPQQTQPLTLYAPGHPLEEACQGGLQVYPLPTGKTQGAIAMDDGILTFSGYGGTTLTLLTGDLLEISASRTLDFELDCRDPSVRVHQNGISFYNRAKQETLVLDSTLSEISRVHITGTVLGSPILSEDKTTLFYCTPTAILAWNLESGIHRTVKELSYGHQELTGSLLGDTILQCYIQDGTARQTLFLDASSGQILAQTGDKASVLTLGSRYYGSLPVSGTQLLLFGETEGLPRILYPRESAAEQFFLPQLHAAVTAAKGPEEHITLAFYALDTGIRQAELTLNSLQVPKSILTDARGSLFFLAYDPAGDCDILCRWDIHADIFSPADPDSQVYTEDYAGKDSSDPNALSQCLAYAEELSQRYGLSIRVGEDAVTVQPWDYRFEAETMPRILYQELELLDQRLGQYPMTVLEKTKSHFTSLSVCLVREISGTAASGSLNTATGVQFLDGSDAYVVIAAGKFSEQALYHELYHVMETRILNKSPAMDQWSDWNPEGFAYTYGPEPTGDLQSWLSGESQAFIDAYSMTFPKEDRARVFEYAMLAGARSLFASETMQVKLTALCEAIRQAYGLRKSPETFPWEQYLKTPLAYTQ